MCVRGWAERGGGAISVTNVQTIQNSRLIGNQANNPAAASDFGGMGAAMFLFPGNATLSDNLFLRNQATTLALDDTVVGGRGGAIFYNNSDPGTVADLVLSASVNGRTLFYGNTHAQAASGPSPNAIHFGNIAPLAAVPFGHTQLTVQANGTGSDGRVLMFDPLSSQADGQTDGFGTAYSRVMVDVSKTGAGDWVLGGVTRMAGAGDWGIQDGTLTLASIFYDTAQTTATSAAVHLLHADSSFTLAGGATLAGSGTLNVAGSTVLNGTLDPSRWVNVGLRADQITSSITDDQIAAIDVSQSATDGGSVYGTLNFSNDVTLDAATYAVDLNLLGQPRSDLLEIGGQLTLTGETEVNVNMVDSVSASLMGNDGVFLLYSSAIVDAYGGANGTGSLRVTSGYGTDADYVQIYTSSINLFGLERFEAGMGLAWNSTASNGAYDGTNLVANGLFTIANGATFTVDNDNLNNHATANLTTTGGAWDGKTLTKAGAGALILAAGDKQYDGGTIVNAGSLTIAAGASIGTNGGTATVNNTAILNVNGTVHGGATVNGGLLDLAAAGIVNGGVTVNAGGTLSGAGTVNGSSTISGAITPAGSGTGTLTFADSVTLNAATYHAQVNYNGGAPVADSLAIGGALTLTGTNVINIDGVNFTGADPLNDANFFAGGSVPVDGQLANIITTGAGISGAGSFELRIANQTLADFAQVYGAQDGDNYRVGVGLSWYSTAKDDAAPYDDKAHGNFTLSNAGDTFTIGGVLANRTGLSGTAWDGMTLDKHGAGTLTLNGANTYTGMTTVHGGTLAIGATGEVLGGVTVAGAGSLLNLAAGSVVHGGVTANAFSAISGTGTIHGSSTVDPGGRIQLTASDALTFSGALTMNQADYYAQVDYDGGAVKVGVLHADTLTLAGAQNVIHLGDVHFTGAMPANDAGFLNGVVNHQLGNVITTTNGITGANSIQLNVADQSGLADYLQVYGAVDGNHYRVGLGLSWTSTAKNALGSADRAHGDFTLTDAADVFTVASDLSDRTGLVGTAWDGKTLDKYGAGELILAGNNSYTGDTNVHGGTLTIAAGGSTGTMAGTFTTAPGTTLNIDGTATAAAFHVGSHLNVGSGGTVHTPTLDVGGNLNVDSGATVNAPTLSVGGNLSVRGVINGVISMANPVVGVMTTFAGSLLVGDFNIAGRLQGTGVIQGIVNMAAGSMLAPGHSIGTQTVGELNLAPGAIYEVEIHPDGSSDRMDVRAAQGSGTASIGGAILNILADASASLTPGDWQQGTDFLILDTDNGVTGRFASVNNPLVFLDAEPLYDNPLQVQLRMTRNTTTFGSVGDACITSNQCAVGSSLDGLDLGHPVVQPLLLMTAAQSRAAYDNLSGEIYGATRAAILGDAQLRDVVQRRLAGGARSAAGAHLWVDVWGASGRIDGDANSAKVDTRSTGLALGGERQFGNTSAGVVFAYEDGKVKQGAGRGARSNLDSYSLGVYAGTELGGGIQVQGGVAYSYLDLDTKRDVSVPTLQGSVRSSAKAHKVQVFTEASRAFDAGSVTVTPYVRAAQVWLRSKDAVERGTAARLQVQGETDSVFQTTVGVRAALELPTRTPAVVYGDVGWVHSAGDVHGRTRNRFANTDARFTVNGAPLDKNAARIGAGVQAQLSPNTSLSLGYQGTLGARQTRHAGHVQLRVRF